MYTSYINNFEFNNEKVSRDIREKKKNTFEMNENYSL